MHDSPLLSGSATSRSAGPSRRHCLGWLGATLAMPHAAFGQSSGGWPERPIKLVIGYPPGGGGDATARPLLPGLQKSLGQPVVMDYRAGASGTLAAAFLAKAPADGYTLHMADSGAISVVTAHRNPGYMPEDFTYLGSPVDLPLVLVAGPDFAASSLKDLIVRAKSQPGRLTYATGGIGGLPHLAGELLKARTGTFILHVAYRGANAALPDVMAGQVDFGLFASGSVIPLIRGRKLKPLAVASAKRLPQLPDVPTAAEQGFPFLTASYRSALLAPKGLPAPIAQRISAALQDTLRDPAVVHAYEGSGFIVNPQSGEATQRIFVEERNSWRKLIAAANLNLQE